MNKTISILGSTGSVGTQTVEVALALGAKVEMLAANRDVDTMEKQARLLKPSLCVMEDEAAAKELKIKLSDTDIEVIGSHEGLISSIGESSADIIFNSIGGSYGLEPTLAAIEAGKDIALSNKESIVMAGDIVMSAAKKKNIKIIPVDSEHSAIFQCLRDSNPIKRIFLTASGGPFFGMKKEGLAAITPKMALAHPTWKMGAKITIDSATLMNKGFEVIEAVHLFGVKPEQVEVVIHRESIIHSMVEYNDNAVMAQMSLPDMRLCAQYAMTYPERTPGIMGELDLTKLGSLTFFKPDIENFPLLKLAFDAIGRGGVIPAALVAADEEAVGAFMNGKIGFCDIFSVVSNALEKCQDIKNPTVEEIIGMSENARAYAAEGCSHIISGFSRKEAYI